MSRAVASVIGLVSLGCGAPQSPSPAVVSPNPSATRIAAPSPAGSVPSSSVVAGGTSAPGPTAPESKCVVTGSVSRGGVTWPLRTRPDAGPALVVEDGSLTQWIGRPPPAPAAWSIPVELENASMKVRAVVLAEDLRLFVTKPFFVRKGWVPDGITERRVLGATDTAASLEIGFEKIYTTTTEVACADLGVMPARIDTEPLLSKAGGDVVLKASAPVQVGDRTFPASSFWTPVAVARPAGALATERGPRTTGAAQLVSIETCGGSVLGEVSKGDLVGQPRKMQASSGHCPGTPTGAFVADPPLDKALKCPADIPLFLRTSASEDPIGTLKADARVQNEGHDENGTTLVRVRNPAAAPTQEASFAVKTVDLATCTPSR